MLLKAGTYRFNKVPNALYNITTQAEFDAIFPIAQFSFNFVSNGINYTKIESMYANGTFAHSGLSFTATEFSSLSYSDDEGTISTQAYGKGTGFDGVTYSGWQNEAYKEHTIPEQEVDDTFGTWYISNTNYNEVNAPVEDTIYTEKSSWYKSVADAIRSKKGTSEPILRDNFASEIESIQGGGSGECSGEHIIEAEELPTENIDESATYETKLKEFVDVAQYDGSSLTSMGIMALGMYYVKTKPTEDIKVSSISGYHFYYVEDEKDVFVFGDMEGTGTNSWMAMGCVGAITDISEATESGLYAILSEYTALCRYINSEWVKHISPSQTLTLKSNGTFDCTNAKTVIVEANPCELKGAFTFKNTLTTSLYTRGLYVGYFSKPFKLTYNVDGVEKTVEIAMISVDSMRFIQFATASAEMIDFYDFRENVWLIPEAKNLDFGEGVTCSPQIYSWFYYNEQV